MARPKVTAVQVPGEASAPQAADSQVDGNTVTSDQAAQGNAIPEAGTLDGAKVDVDALQAQNAALLAELAAAKELLAKKAATKTEAVAPAVDSGGHKHLHSSEIDATKLSKAVLAKDGWVVPPTLGPAAPKFPQ